MAEAKTQPSQEFEKVLKDSATEVASFERHDKSLLERIQHALHSNPALVPLIVLVLSVVIFGAAPGLEVLLALRADADPAAGGDRRDRRLGADPRGPDRRHRPLGRGDHGAVLGGDGAVHLPLRHPDPDLDSLRLRRRRADRLRQRVPHRQDQAAALHRHARHVADRARDELPLLAQRDDPQPGHRRPGAAPEALRLDGRRLADPRHRRHAAAGAGAATTS